MQPPPRICIIIFGAIVALSGVVLLFTTPTQHKANNHQQLQNIAKPYTFDFISWELHALFSLTEETSCRQSKADQETKLHDQIKTVLTDEGIPTFPPITFSLEEPPHLLVVSPRNKIVYLDRKLLRQDLSIEEKEELEAQIGKMDISSLVITLGGFGATYPPIISNRLRLTDTINTMVEEWFHQYLAFRPLGFLYFLDSIGFRQDPDVIIMNETLASIVSEEIGSIVYARYYNGQQEVEVEATCDDLEFNFNTEMRKTRTLVDQYLSQGRIEDAEHYMEKRRKEFTANGYYIRKLNQAYFAFHGIYGQDPASVTPIYSDLKKLRGKSPSLKHFIDVTASMRSYTDLRAMLEE